MPVKIRGLRCPSCGQQGKVRVGNVERKEDFTLRYRICDNCGHHFKTHEYMLATKQGRKKVSR